MEKIIILQRKIAPDLVAVVEERYNILKHIQYAQPIGRRALAAVMGMSERVVRADVEFLKDAGLVEISGLGMSVTEDGHHLIAELAEYVGVLHGLTQLETTLSERLGIRQVIIVPGDSETDSSVLRELGRTAAGILTECLQDNMIIAVSGGSTMARVAETVNVVLPTVTVVPARGGLGEQVEYQANIIAAVMATKLGGRYRLLHIPDGMSEEALDAVMASDANVSEIADMIKHADILIQGIGEAGTMSKRRSHEPETISFIGQNCVGEALGHYFSFSGECIYTTNSVGFRLDDLAKVGKVIAVAGGRHKAEAIVAVTRAAGQDVLVIDEAAARAIQSII
ncbi:DNA-binding transcriptional regulator|uniref:Central glycolytic genes regulator n=1 Tax=Dendrosporobacter quercicolus TaxID=146817 RepID=A0A1G9YW90_9FIRM|nr:sugar-binding domain-containing protein [Dendrosporobacter quercicolus]NSL49290.1 DNA-binding transcriptional regulator [Dendrosporobacter quercicolus DSM 1736]SDN13177.1 central glycolytic genes regulator [Dendrosporobacter quercicolus]